MNSFQRTVIIKRLKVELASLPNNPDTLQRRCELLTRMNVLLVEQLKEVNGITEERSESKEVIF